MALLEDSVKLAFWLQQKQNSEMKQYMRCSNVRDNLIHIFFCESGV